MQIETVTGGEYNRARRPQRPTEERRVGMFRPAYWWSATDRRGVTALEYALVGAVMGVLIVTAFSTLGSSLDTAYMAIGTLITATTAGM
jgi:pilus assembly protein Flp/PilA